MLYKGLYLESLPVTKESYWDERDSDTTEDCPGGMFYITPYSSAFRMVNPLKLDPALRVRKWVFYPHLP